MQLTAKVDKPAGLYLLPRMAAGRMGRWWHKHNIDIFTRMIRHAILFNEVDPNRVYIMGISQGGYGSCHLAPFLADLFAGAGPMDG
jgi:poly(3-hydroxybutyrate) depolymerase